MENLKRILSEQCSLDWFKFNQALLSTGTKLAGHVIVQAMGAVSENWSNQDTERKVEPLPLILIGAGDDDSVPERLVTMFHEAEYKKLGTTFDKHGLYSFEFVPAHELERLAGPKIYLVAYNGKRLIAGLPFSAEEIMKQVKDHPREIDVDWSDWNDYFPLNLMYLASHRVEFSFNDWIESIKTRFPRNVEGQRRHFISQVRQFLDAADQVSFEGFEVRYRESNANGRVVVDEAVTSGTNFNRHPYQDLEQYEGYFQVRLNDQRMDNLFSGLTNWSNLMVEDAEMDVSDALQQNPNRYHYSFPDNWRDVPEVKSLTQAERSTIESGKCFDVPAQGNRNMQRFLSENIYENVAIASASGRFYCFTRSNIARQYTDKTAIRIPCKTTGIDEMDLDTRFYRLDFDFPVYIPQIDFLSLIADYTTQVFQTTEPEIKVQYTASLSYAERPGQMSSDSCQEGSNKQISRIISRPMPHWTGATNGANATEIRARATEILNTYDRMRDRTISQIILSLTATDGLTSTGRATRSRNATRQIRQAQNPY